MDKKMNRRTFIRTGAVGLAGLSALGTEWINTGCTSQTDDLMVDRVKLGKTGLTVSRLAMGTGSIGGNKESNQTRLGMEKFVELAHHAYERGIRFYDMADSYGSHPFVGEALKSLPRKKVTLLTKMWSSPDGSELKEPVDESIRRYLAEIGTDYIDILVMHCMMEEDWPNTRKSCMEAFAKAKQNGIVRAVGVSCHNLKALEQAAVHPWVDVIMARINPFQTAMDGSPDVVREILATACRNGKGVIGMKIFGEGKNASDSERQQSIHYAITQANIHCMTLGLESVAQMDDAIKRTMTTVKAQHG